MLFRIMQEFFINNELCISRFYPYLYITQLINSYQFCQKYDDAGIFNHSRSGNLVKGA
jgi:hypothetical protein